MSTSQIHTVAGIPTATSTGRLLCVSALLSLWPLLWRVNSLGTETELALCHGLQQCPANVGAPSSVAWLRVCLVKFKSVLSAPQSGGRTDSEGKLSGAVLCSYWVMCIYSLKVTFYIEINISVD